MLRCFECFFFIEESFFMIAMCQGRRDEGGKEKTTKTTEVLRRPKSGCEPYYRSVERRDLLLNPCVFSLSVVLVPRGELWVLACVCHFKEVIVASLLQLLRRLFMYILFHEPLYIHVWVGECWTKGSGEPRMEKTSRKYFGVMLTSKDAGTRGEQTCTKFANDRRESVPVETWKKIIFMYVLNQLCDALPFLLFHHPIMQV